MSNVADPVLRATSWIPKKVTPFNGGEDRLSGQVIEVKGWYRWSDKAKIKCLRELAKKYGVDPHMRWFVVNQVLRPAGVVQRDYRGQAAALLSWVQHRIYYTNEPDEQVQSPWRTIKVRTGDCDDSALLLATMAHSIGLPWRFVLAGKNRAGKPIRWAEGTRMPWGASFAHIYVDLGWPPFSRNPVWASAEQTVRGAPLGYDVVRDGLKRWGETAPALQLPELGQQLAGMHRMPGPAYAGPMVYGNVSGECEDEGFTFPWSQIIVGVVEGTITAVVIALILRKLKV